MNPINPVCRPATENEINYGEAKWCAKCTSECDSKGKDELVMCDYFKTNDNDPIVPGCPSLMPHALPGGFDSVAPAEEGTPMNSAKMREALESGEGKRGREMSNKQETIAGIVNEMRQAEATWHRSEIAQLPTQYLKEWSDRIEAAHQREVAELRECLKIAVVNARIARTCYAFGLECDSCGQSCNARKWKKVIEATKGAEDEGKRDD